MFDGPSNNDTVSADTGGLRVHVITYGCQMNVFDSRRMVQILGHDGWTETSDPALADAILINTCSVRDRPEQKVLSTLARLKPLKDAKPDMVFGVTGCVARQHGAALLNRVKSLDLVLGPDEVGRVAEAVAEARDGRRLALVDDIPHDELVFPQVDPVYEPGPTAFLTIIKGCENHCAYCIVPQVRGREVSKPFDQVLSEASALVAGGVREITLLGQNVNAYGQDRPGSPRFARLVESVSAIDGLQRLRFVTSHPADADDAMLDLFGRLPNLAEYLHLPVQAGSDYVLARMNRGYDVASYLNRIDRVRKACPDIAISTDIIVGFPGETREDFEGTLEVLRQVQYDLMFSFKYSPRPGTLSARWPDDVPSGEKTARLAELQALGDEIATRRIARYAGRTESVLVEGPSRDQMSGRVRTAGREWMGRARSNVVINFPEDGRPVKAGDVVDVVVDEVMVHSLRGRRITRDTARNP